MTAPRPGLWRGLAGLAACLLLAACMLTSQTPRFAEADLQPILGDHPAQYDAFRRENGVWVAADNLLQVTLIPQGRHYLMPDPEKPEAADAAILLGFLPLSDGRYLVQGIAGGAASPEQTYYGTASWDGHDLILSLIGCGDLRKRTDIADLVSFAEDDCTLLPIQGNWLETADRLGQGLPPGDTRLTLRP